ncbi:MAG: hypothetical protein NTZ38_02750 [Candidatus Taylorbacteria bacterium]|nr:hypothetical protein [Candidatus Taylorbacteria bacterium]
MTELTTSVVFLMSSLYGASHANTMNAANMAAAYDAGDQASTSQAIEMTDNDQIEAYIRAQYADTPILVDIARCESRFHQFNEDGTVVRGEINKKDVGIMQINETYHEVTMSHNCG